MKNLFMVLCILIPCLGFAQSESGDDTTKSIIFVVTLFAILFIGALFKTFLVLRDREREKSSGNKCQYGGPIEGGCYDV